MPSYADQTVNASNPLARLAHRNRTGLSLRLALQRLRGTLLDYGCGTGHFIQQVNSHRPGFAVGYEPYLKERAANGLPIYRRIEEVQSQGPFQIVTLFETIEHLHPHELADFLAFCEQNLTYDGGILISGPIEIGPAAFAKELNRSLLHRRKPEHGPFELLAAGLLGIPAKRATDIKSSHKGFDFRQAIQAIKDHGWSVRVLGYGPLPIRTWYGNSQFYLWVTRRAA